MSDQQRLIGGRLPACIAGNAPSICHRSSSAAYLWLQWDGCCSGAVAVGDGCRRRRSLRGWLVTSGEKKEAAYATSLR